MMKQGFFPLNVIKLAKNESKKDNLGGEMPTTRFYLNLSYEQVMRYYQGQAGIVYVQDIYGRRVQFPANLLRQLVNRQGVYGLFEIEYSVDGKCVAVKKITP
ncbi:DUF2835 family protein [Piscirickettsia salmonis]|uniref:Topoisomerase II n=3 Tax=Piscirickettsia salmonis TaxID=1238 RepID=A0AAC8VJE4_PISSA|nr:DUF2835 family protein [Piscirickettsia salmonis]ALB23331.1 topoisomerase II [Piscirickettsia salmonis]QGO01683.1 hypothetical protein Psal008_01064 [Piscirickettsia salmonis]QGO12380.1 hypothetical protein Psal010b_01053 [Piscirickettsia salmonis]QGO19414.1 hypothetical protein Psal013_01058 [Piscirickettsia salmonis]QGO67180.1 hypothetical protein Psal073_02147 [Piscirickettsia salmonis]